MQIIILTIITILTILMLDIIWLGFVAKKLYDDNIGMLLRKTGGAMTPIWPSAIMVYIFIAIGILYFVLPKANGNYVAALFAGAMFGAVSYGIYDFTNYAILANWPLKITLIDFAWGITLCSISSVIITFVQNHFFS